MSERIGTITTTHGEKYEVYALKAGHLAHVTHPDMSEMNLRMAARSVRVELEDFKEWDLQDALKVISLQNQAFEVLK